MTKILITQKGMPCASSLVWNFENSKFDIVSYFEFRASNLESPFNAIYNL